MRTEPATGTSAESPEEEYVLSLGDLLQVIRRRLWIIALTAILCVGAAVAYSLYQTPQYEGKIIILVGQEQESAPSSNLGSDVQGLEKLTQTVARAVSTRAVAEAVIRELGLQTDSEYFLENLTVEQIPRTQFVEAAYRSPSPEDARRIANTVGEVLSRQVSEVGPSANSLTATVWDRAVTPEEPVSPNPVRNGLLALILGLMLGIGLAFLLEYLDDSWRSPEEVEQILGVPTFGMIPEFDAPKGKKDGR